MLNMWLCSPLLVLNAKTIGHLRRAALYADVMISYLKSVSASTEFRLLDTEVFKR